MEFNPNNPIIILCIQGMALEETGRSDEAAKLFLRAWKEATNDFEKYLAAYFVARHQKNVRDRLNWLEKSLQLALQINSSAVRGAYATLYSAIAKCYEDLQDPDNADKYHEWASSFAGKMYDNGPFFHGTKANLEVGDLLTARSPSNYKAGIIMNHVYFTALMNGAGLAASLAQGDGPERVYIVEPTGSFENDPNVTDKKFPGNPTRSYRTREPLKIIGEVTDWQRQTPEDIAKWREKLANSKGDIIN